MLLFVAAGDDPREIPIRLSRDRDRGVNSTDSPSHMGLLKSPNAQEEAQREASDRTFVHGNRSEAERQPNVDSEVWPRSSHCILVERQGENAVLGDVEGEAKSKIQDLTVDLLEGEIPRQRHL